jgi:hypothetical protein
MTYVAMGAFLLCLIALPISLISMISRNLRRRAIWAAIATTVGLVASLMTFTYARDQERGGPRFGGRSSAIAQTGAVAHAEPFASEVNRAIEEHKVIVGMTPQEAAQAAAAAYVYKVKADPERWPRGSDPRIVIARQTLEPDNSEITLTFSNKTQFDSAEPMPFRVEIRQGRVTDIVALRPPRA